jgi:hypothetical protein
VPELRQEAKRLVVDQPVAEPDDVDALLADRNVTWRPPVRRKLAMGSIGLALLGQLEKFGR